MEARTVFTHYPVARITSFIACAACRVRSPDVVEQVDAKRESTVNLTPGVPFQGFTRSVDYLDVDAIVAAVVFDALEVKTETAVGLDGERPVFDYRIGTIYGVEELGVGQRVTGIGLDFAGYLDLVSLDVQLVVGIPYEFKGGKDEFVHPYLPVSQLFAIGFDAHGIHTAAGHAGQGELTCHRTESVGDERHLGCLFSLCVEQDGGDFGACGAKRVLVGSGVEDGLEPHGLVRIVSSAVGDEKAAGDRGIAELPHLSGVGGPHADELAPALASVIHETGPEVVFSVLCGEILFELLGKRREAIHRNTLYALDLLAVGVIDVEIACFYGLAGHVIGHIGSVAIVLGPDRYREGMLAVIQHILAVSGLEVDLVVAVVQAWELHYHCILYVVRALLVGDVGLVQHGGIVFFLYDFVAERLHVTERERHLVVLHLGTDGLGVQVFYQV